MVVSPRYRSVGRFAGIFIIAFLLCVFAFSMETAGPQETPITFIHKERSLQPGELILVEALSSQPLKQLRVKAFGRDFPAFSEDGEMSWTGLVGIDLEIKPGSYKITLSGIDADGKSVSAHDMLAVKAKKFPTRELTVDPKYVTPPPDVTARIEKEGAKVNEIFASSTPKKLWSGSFQLPVPGEVISVFGKRSIYNGQPRSPHKGTDFRGAPGTPIRAPNAGKVVLASNLYYTGNTVILDHGLGLHSYFGHMSAFSVKEGALVRTGDIVGKVGATGMVTGPHLHWTVCLLGIRVDPLSLVEILADP
jgi:murein DD-endopeptidase MepM/ murein hydrolase activator NlpD